MSIKDTIRSQTAMCWMMTTITLCSLKTLYFMDAMRMTVSPIKDEATTNRKYPAQAYLALTFSMPKTVLLLYVDIELLNETTKSCWRFKSYDNLSEVKFKVSQGVFYIICSHGMTALRLCYSATQRSYQFHFWTILRRLLNIKFAYRIAGITIEYSLTELTNEMMTNNLPVTI